MAEEMAMNDEPNFHLTAPLRRRDKLIRIGINSRYQGKELVRYLNQSSTHDYTAHAEMNALLMTHPDDILEVLRWHKDGQLALAKPYPHRANRVNRLNLAVRYTREEGNLIYL